MKKAAMAEGQGRPLFSNSALRVICPSSGLSCLPS
jgi:hypothetical protein